MYKPCRAAKKNLKKRRWLWGKYFDLVMIIISWKVHAFPESAKKEGDKFLQDISEKLQAHTYVWSDKNDPDLYGDWVFEVYLWIQIIGLLDVCYYWLSAHHSELGVLGWGLVFTRWTTYLHTSSFKVGYYYLKYLQIGRDRALHMHCLIHRPMLKIN